LVLFLPLSQVVLENITNSGIGYSDLRCNADKCPFVRFPFNIRSEPLRCFIPLGDIGQVLEKCFTTLVTYKTLSIRYQGGFFCMNWKVFVLYLLRPKFAAAGIYSMTTRANIRLTGILRLYGISIVGFGNIN